MPLQKKSRVFITGANGFVGANITRRLLKNNYDIHILNHSHSDSLTWRINDLRERLTIHQGDITNKSQIKRLMKIIQPEYIIHLAVYGAYHFQTDLEKIISVNIEGTKNLLEATKDIPYRCFINTGSSSEYGYKKKPMKESSFCDPVSYYAATKLATTYICKIFAQINNKPIVTFRLFSVYGPYEAPTRLVPAITNALIQNDVIKLSSGVQRRDFIYIEDVCDAYLKALSLGKKLQGEICNIGTGNEYTNEEMVNTLFQVTKKKTIVQKDAYPKRVWDTPHWKADITHTKKILSWQPIYTIDKGLERTYSWFEQNSSLYQ